MDSSVQVCQFAYFPSTVALKAQRKVQFTALLNGYHKTKIFQNRNKKIAK